jgi:drug/metabolite transporter (DMT)-like permease
VHAPSLSPFMIAAVLAAALLHAAWNSIAHGIGDRLVGFAMIGVVDLVGGGALAALAGPPTSGAWPYIVASAVVHIGYNLLLLASYQLGEFSQTYPLARGTAPLVVALVSVLLLHRPLAAQDLAGILAVSSGLIGLVLAGGIPRRKELPAVAAALATGLLIALYTVIDGVGVAEGPLLPYIGWMFLLQGPALPVLAALRRGRRLPALLRRHALPGLAGGAISLAAYSIVLWAQTSGALAPIAALRESSIVFGALIGAVFLREPLGHRRAVAAGVVLAGVLLLSL